MCSAFNAFVERSVSVIKGVLSGPSPKAKRQQQLATPWMNDLERLAAQRKDEDMPSAPPQVHLDEVTAFVNELAKCSKPQQQYTSPEETAKPKRVADGTVTDLKSWWGESVATWDPETNGKNLDTSDQRSHVRSAKWFKK